MNKKLGRPKLSKSSFVRFRCPNIATARFIMKNSKEIICFACENIGRKFDDSDIRTNKRTTTRIHTSRDVWFTCKKDVGDWVLDNREKVIEHVKKIVK